MDYYHQILEISSKDSDIKKILSTNEYVELNQEMFEERTDVYMMLQDKEYDSSLYDQYRPLKLDKEAMYYETKYHEKIKIKLKDINKIGFDIVYHYQNFGIYSQYIFYPTIDFIRNDMTLKFKAMNQNDFIDIIMFLQSLNIPIEDEKHIIDVYFQYKDNFERHKYFQRKYLYK